MLKTTKKHTTKHKQRQLEYATGMVENYIGTVTEMDICL
jgi:hypothetical protein